MVDTVNLIRTEAHKNSPRDTGKLQDKGWKSGSQINDEEITGFVLNDVENEKGVQYASYTEGGTENKDKSVRIKAQNYLKNASIKGMRALPETVSKRMEPILKKVK
jgi:hypothetical protein